MEKQTAKTICFQALSNGANDITITLDMCVVSGTRHPKGAITISASDEEVLNAQA